MTNDDTKTLDRQSTVLAAATESADGFGAKTITFFGGCCLCINNITGPGLPALGLAFQQGGWLFSTFLLTFFTVVSTLCSGFLIEAMTKVPGNHRLQGRVEFTYLAKKYFSTNMYLITLFLFLFSFQSSNISSVILSSQTSDSTLLAIFGKTCALRFYPNPGFVCITKNVVQGDNSPFGNWWVLSIGYLLVLAMTIPFGFMNLDENIIIQIGSTFCLTTICLMWGLEFLGTGFNFTGMGTTGWLSDVPAIGSDQTSAIGTILFNFAWVTTVPSWINEKKPGVNVNYSLWLSAIFSWALFMIVGLLACMSMHFTPGEDLIARLNTGKMVWGFIKISAQVFPWTVLLTGIPVFSIMVRYNLLENKLCNKFWANMFATVFPWVAALVFYAGNLLNTVLNWSSLFIMVPLNFTLPCIIYLRSLDKPIMDTDSLGHPLLGNQTDVMDTVHEEPGSRSFRASFDGLSVPSRSKSGGNGQLSTELALPVASTSYEQAGAHDADVNVLGLDDNGDPIPLDPEYHCLPAPIRHWDRPMVWFFLVSVLVLNAAAFVLTVIGAIHKK